ncbi:MAG: hypothetical protein M3Y87_11365 [Myxococcota bacterium]|nr:hypothetical protein [Myxococcota bacterium]
MATRTERKADSRRRELNPHRVLLESLLAELFQSERSAEIHPPKEASRLGDSAPARALRAVSQHARSVRAELRELARERDLKATEGGSKLGDLFSWARRTLSDGMMEEERSYRATLLGMRHGLDLVKLVRSTAESADDGELAGWCTEWLSVREPLVEEVCSQLAWFGWHPERALHHPGGIGSLLDRLLGGPRQSRPTLGSAIGSS